MHALPLFSPFAIAPMIDWTYPLFRVFMRLMLPKALLYTDMQTLGAIENNPTRALAFHAIEQPLALQVGGPPLIDPWVAAAQQAVTLGFVELNMNLGCPSDKVQSGQFGACLMREPEAVARCITAMKTAVSIPISAKIRIGIDHDDSYDHFVNFVGHLIHAGCDKVIVHARKAWLNGLSPKQNRMIPPLHYDYVYRVKQAFPGMCIVINGNITNLDAVNAHLEHVDGVMLGRLACDNPYALVGIYQRLYPECEILTRTQLVRAYVDFLKTNPLHNASRSHVLKPLLNLAHGLPSARLWKSGVLAIESSDDWQGFEHALDCLQRLEMHQPLCGRSENQSVQDD